MKQQNLSITQSFEAIIAQLEVAKISANTTGLNPARLVLKGLHPHAVVNASKTFKVRLFGAHDGKNWVNTEYEPFEDRSVKLILISRPIHSIAMREIVRGQQS